MSEAPRRALRLGILAPGYPSGAPGDYRGIFVQQLVRQLESRGHRVCVVTSRLLAGDVPLQCVGDREVVHRFGFWSEGRHLVEYPRIPVARTLSYLWAASRLARREFRTFGCDLIHSHFIIPMGLVGARVSRSLGVPHVLTAHGSDARMVTRRRWMHPLGRWILRRSDAVTASAFHVKDDLQVLMGEAATQGMRQEIVQLPMGIHEAYFGQPALDVASASASSAAARGATILSTRSLREEPYRISFLLHAMKLLDGRLPEVHCTIAGEGSDRARYETQAHELGLSTSGRVEFVGWCDPEHLAARLQASSVYVSTSAADGASVSLFEAMASGAYPVVSDIAANREWIRHGENGSLFAVDDPAALADAIAGALADPGAMQRARELNRARAREEFSWPGIAQRMEKIYFNLLGE